MTSLSVIARVRTDFPEKFGLPRQSGIVPALTGTVVFEEAYRVPDALRGIEGFSHLWLLWGFSEGFSSQNEPKPWSPTVRPPRLGEQFFLLHYSNYIQFCLFLYREISIF